jgi:DNA-binding GntR family transcriptional regulator
MPQVALNRSSRAPLHAQLYEGIAQSISGGVELGARLPSTRTMAKLLGVSRNTVLAAYDLLVAENLIRGERGSGMRVNAGPGVDGIQAIRLRSVIREARYPTQTVSFTDPEGNSLYINL